LAGFAVYDFLYFKKTSKTEGLTLQLPKIIKDKIHAIIGSQYRVAPEQRTRQAQKRYFLSLVFGAFVVGFFISLLEAVCTGQMYLPTITFVLKNPALRMRALLYLLLYNFMFIVPLMIILIAAVLDTTSQKFASLANKHMLTIKLLMALVFIIFGILMLVGA
jgi:cytochrome c biogenesis protein CcdA